MGDTHEEEDELGRAITLSRGQSGNRVTPSKIEPLKSNVVTQVQISVVF
jgi:aspartate ammonia-lyase